MQKILLPKQLSTQLEQLKSKGKTIGFVPTMGALHSGHIALVRQSISQNDITVVSIFVNPTQFNNSEDLKQYPRTLDEDCRLLENCGCDIVFAPSHTDIYNSDDTNKPFDFDFEGLDSVMEGKFRPNHFNGVVQIVSKLFGIISPNRAYFGEKDFQQLAIIRLMTKKMKFEVEIVACPTLRESSGLALSSRNMRLSDTQKEVAPHIYAVLKESTLFALQTQIEELKECTIAAIDAKSELKVEYFDIVDGNTLKTVENWDNHDYIVGCIAVFCGKIRLIDNIRYK